ncbi:hypothetical protein DBR06_SOUSAS3410170, partial [Sousa chinensis]
MTNYAASFFTGFLLAQRLLKVFTDIVNEGQVNITRDE